MNEPRTLQQWIKQLRAAQDLTQEALAEHVGCAPQTIRLIERGARRPSRAMAERLADVLHVAPAERPAFLRVARPPRIPVAPEAAPHGAPVPSHAHPLPAASLPVPSVPLLVTKILPPPARRHVLPRPRLTAQLGTFHDSLVTLIAAPAGWGKTTLLTAWIGSLPPAETRRVAWVALDEADNDPVRLLRYIIAALQRVAPELGVTAVALLDAPQPALDAVLAVLINDLAALEQPVALVLDDYHLVRAPAMHQALAFLIDHLPPRLHLLIATREDPPLPLARLRGRQQLHEIRAANLRFTPAEVQIFFADVMNVTLQPADIAALNERTEGWATGLQLAALALQDRADTGHFVRSFTGSHRLVLDYLAEEVLDRLPSHLLAFLLHTSVLDRFCGALCDAVLAEAHPKQAAVPHDHAARLQQHPSATASDRLLGELERANLFLVPLDDERTWYRYHHLFGMVLRERLRRSVNHDLVAMLHRRAAAWFAAHGLLPDAIHHALAGGYWQDAAQMIEAIGDRLLHDGAVATLRHYIDALPEATRANAPQVLYLLGRCLRHQWDYQTARTLFERAVQGFTARGDLVRRGIALSYLSDCYRSSGDVAQARVTITEALRDPLPPAQRAIALVSAGWDALAAGAWQEATGNVDQAVALMEAAHDVDLLHEVAFGLRAPFMVLPGGIARAERVCRLILRHDPPALSPLRAAAYASSGLVWLLRGNAERATHELLQALHVSEHLGGLMWIAIDTHACYARCALLQNDVDEAARRIAVLMTLLQHPLLTDYMANWGPVFHAMLGYLRWIQGRGDEVRAIDGQMHTAAHAQEWPTATFARLLVRGLSLLTTGAYADAEPVLQAAVVEQQRFRDTAPIADAGVLLAYVYLQMGRDADALGTLAPILAAYEHEDMPGLLLLLGAPVVVPLLKLAIMQHVHPVFARRMLHVFRHGNDEADPAVPLGVSPAVLHDPHALTPREREVLHLLAAGMTNDAIAAQLVVSPATVKKHINHLFAKLGAKNRMQALLRARERDVV